MTFHEKGIGMRLVTYRAGTTQRVGVATGATVVDISKLAPDMLTLIEGGPALLDQVRALAAQGGEGVALDSVELLAPIPRPRKNIVCLGMNYAEHAYEGQRARGLPEKLPEDPVFFSKAITAINHPNGVIPFDPQVSSQIDWEVELAFVIGRQGKNISRDEALSYIFGYTILNDISARDLQSRHKQFFRAKSLDGCAPLGPWIVTADEIADPQQLRLSLRVNGKTMQDSSTNDMIFDIPTIIATLSHGMTLEPGDIIATGTPSGVGLGMNPPQYLKPGDVVEAEVEGIGVLRSLVGSS
jgi:2-keto-4-pentenoate hydratase/2-oxohepta-3-ene-1,7-dioic acid hydratase in catechol pathway